LTSWNNCPDAPFRGQIVVSRPRSARVLDVPFETVDEKKNVRSLGYGRSSADAAKRSRGG